MLILLLAGLLLFLHTSAGKELLREKVEAYLQKKWKTAVSIGRIDYTLPNWLRLERVLIPDQQNDTLLYAGDLYVRIKMLKLLQNTVDVTTIGLKNATVNLRRERDDPALNCQFIFDSFAKSPKKKKDTAGSKPLHLAVKQLTLQQVQFSLNDKKKQVFLFVHVNRLSCLPALLDPGKGNYKINTLGIANCKAMLTDSSKQIKNYTLQADSLSLRQASLEPKKIYVETITGFNNSFSYHNTSLPKRNGIDGNHLDVQRFNLQLSKSSYGPSGVSGSLIECSFLLNKQMNVKQLYADFRLTDSLLQVTDAAFTINYSNLRSRGTISLPIAKGTYSLPPSQFLIETGSVTYSDVLLAVPALAKKIPLQLLPSDRLTFTSKVSVTGRQVAADGLRIAVSRNLLLMNGRLALQRKQQNQVLLADLRQFQLKRELLSKKLLHQLKNSRITLPEAIALTGSLQSSKALIKANLHVNSTFGQVTIQGTAKNISHPHQLVYDVQLKPDRFETGKWTGLDSIVGKITGEITVKGSGIDPKTMTATAAIQLSSAEINGNAFSGIELHAGLNRSAFSLAWQTRDPNLQTTCNLQGHLGPDYLANGTLHVAYADLKQIRLTNDSLVYSGALRLHAAYKQPGTLVAEIVADSNNIIISGQNFQTNDFYFLCRADGDSTNLLVKAPFLSAQLASNSSIDQLGRDISVLATTIYPPDTASIHQPMAAAQSSHTVLQLTLTEDSLLNVLAPGLSLLQPITVTGRMNPAQKDSLLLVQVLAPRFRYKQIDGHNLRIDGLAAQNSIRIKTIADDSTGRHYFAGGIQVKKEHAATVINILDTLILNYNNWTVSANNSIHLMKEGYLINHLLLQNREQSISLSSQASQKLSPLVIRIEHFDIGRLFNLLSPGDSLGVKGLLNADMVLQQPIQKIPLVTGTINATGIAYGNIQVGDFTFQSTTTSDSLLLQGTLSGGNQLYLYGGIGLKEKALAVQVQLQRLDMDMVHGFTSSFLSRLSGKVTGSIQVTGTVSKPSVNGQIDLDSILFAIKELNTPYHINKQKLVVENSDLHFSQFSLTDSAGHPFTINGKIAGLINAEQKLDLTVATRDFAVLNAPRQPGNLLYGTGIIDVAVSLKGTSLLPVIEGNAFLQGKSNIHAILATQSTANRNKKEGIIFVDIDTLNRLATQVTKGPADTITVLKPITGFRYNLNLKVDKEASLSILMDPSHKDELVLKGEAQLNAGIGKDGSSSLTGVYRLQSGYYQMNNLLLRGKFLVTKGSTVTFNGDPAAADADISTAYQIVASPKNLLNYKDDNTSLPPRVTFSVVFLIKGSLSKPELSFDIQLEQGKEALQSSVKSDIEHALSRLRNDVAEMNKQVFSLLLTKQFVATGEQTDLESSNLNASNALKEGVSSFLSAAMNQMADQLIKGVDVDVNVNTYKTADDPVSKTDLGVSMSKNLFEDRLVIRIEENIPVGNTTATAQKSGSQYIPDITSTYKLSKDGRLQLRAYQKNEYDAVLQGYFTQYGINFTFELAYDKLKELIKRNKQSANEKE
ncbi:hypothetical protein A4D02_23225 [Niastella koreensis]|uniref:Translocation/assembly module TamB n=1 Tax=Niastella koreensis TaxID=354356 RepID=A0ABX3P2T8_9BACT|nr:hypothetical protein A4D02_23225 [Niastella koreensis]